MENQVNIVSLAEDGELRASTESIATGYKLQHRAVLQLVRKYADKIESFGPCAFEVRVAGRAHGGGKNVEFALLNQHQAMFLLTLMRNTSSVVDFKVQLIQEFIRMSEALKNRDMTMWDKRLKFEAKDQASKSLGSHGSHLMHNRRKEKPVLKTERLRLIEEMEQPLFSN